MRRFLRPGGRTSLALTCALVLALGGLVLLGFDMLVWKAGPKYTRSDCLVRVDLEYIQEDWIEEKTVRMLVAGMWGFENTPEGIPIDAIGAGSLQGLDDDPPWVRIAYKMDCEQRFAMTQLYIDEFERNHPGLARFTISRDRLEPKYKGHCFSGPAWIDTDC